MANSRIPLTPQSAENPDSNYPSLLRINARPVLAFDADTKETCYWTTIAPQGLTGTLTAYVYGFMASATAGDVDIDVAVEAITPGDSFDLDAGDSFDTVNSTDATSVPGTAGYLFMVTVTLTNKDSIAAGDQVRFSLARDAPNDSATGDLYVTAMEIRDDV